MHNQLFSSSTILIFFAVFIIAGMALAPLILVQLARLLAANGIGAVRMERRVASCFNRKFPGLSVSYR